MPKQKAEHQMSFEEIMDHVQIGEDGELVDCVEVLPETQELETALEFLDIQSHLLPDQQRFLKYSLWRYIAHREREYQIIILRLLTLVSGIFLFLYLSNPVWEDFLELVAITATPFLTVYFLHVDHELQEYPNEQSLLYRTLIPDFYRSRRRAKQRLLGNIEELKIDLIPNYTFKKFMRITKPLMKERHIFLLKDKNRKNE